MDRNFFLAMGLSFVVLVLWTMYSEARRPPEPPPGEAAPELAAAPEAPAPAPSASAPPALAPLEPAAPPAPAPEVARLPEERVRIQTELVDAEFSSWGGGLVRWSLLGYDDPSQPGRPPVDIATLGPRGGVALATRFEELGLGDLSLASYRTEQPDAKTLVFTHERSGLRVRKTYLFEDEYGFRLRLEIENGSNTTVGSSFIVDWPVTRRESADFEEYSVATYQDGELANYFVAAPPAFLGMGPGAADEPEQHVGNVDWAGAQTRYFLAALLPDNPRDASMVFTPTLPGEEALVQVGFAKADLPPGGRLDREYRVYLGPKEPDRLDTVGSHLDEAIQKGWFPSLTRFFTWLLTAAHKVVPNYGIAIILITIAVRLLMAPLMARQMKSMKRMSVLQPRMKEIQEKYPDDRQKQSEAMMALYREAGVNPLSMMTGCLPMFLQLPVFIGFYYALQGAIQLRQQPFFGWIDDLSRPEALFVIPGLELPVRLLPILMGASMVAQQKLTPTAMDPAQARMMLTVMPVMFTVMFYQFASGLVLYWFVSTLLGIGQQFITNRSKT
ncbi:MAG: membrane protein insertase YidC [Myxococcota bacterium]